MKKIVMVKTRYGKTYEKGKPYTVKTQYGRIYDRIRRVWY